MYLCLFEEPTISGVLEREGGEQVSHGAVQLLLLTDEGGGPFSRSVCLAGRRHLVQWQGVHCLGLGVHDK